VSNIDSVMIRGFRIAIVSAALLAVVLVFVSPLIQLPNGILKQRGDVQPVIVMFFVAMMSFMGNLLLHSRAFLTPTHRLDPPTNALQDVTCARRC
jgi:hypothetical protein